MLNIGKLAPGAESYYLDTVASGVEDYYTGSGEAHGYWIGAGASALELAGRVEPEVLRAVLGALDPATGQPLTGRMSRRSVPGFDCTFRAPKSVSLLYGLGDVAASCAVRDAHDTAVAAALTYLEQHAGFSRRGHGGAERVPVTGFAAAAFRHRTSRAGDPLLHTHVLVANLGQASDDGKWRTLDGRSLYVHAKTAGYLYQAQLRAELTRSLGVEWGEVRNGCSDIAGVPDDVIRAFSQRRAQIEAHMAARGDTSAKAAQTAALATRSSKNDIPVAEVMGAEWLTRAAALGFGADRVAALVGKDVTAAVEPTALLDTVDELLGPAGLTQHASTFTRRDVVRAWCERLPAGADTERVLALADAILGSGPGAVVRLDHAQALAERLAGDQIIRRQDGQAVAAGSDEPRYSTPDLLALEQRLVAAAVKRQQGGTAMASEAAISAALARRPTLSEEQTQMVRRLTASGAGVEVVVGKAGAGKTFALDAARDAWHSSGIRVIGCALAARAAAELHAGAGIDSYTIDALLNDLDRGGRFRLPRGSVVLVDEAAMVGTRKLARLFDHIEQAAAKVVLVGDHHQLPEIDAGGVFRGLVNRLHAIELCDNRRQVEPWERNALDELRTGDPRAALAAYTNAGRIVIGDTAEAVREQLVADWWTARADAIDAADVGVMIAARVSDVEDLNDRARVRLSASGELTGPTVEAANGRQFQAGDRIVCLRNDRRLRVVNGTRAHVSAVDPEAGTLTACLDGQRVTVVVPRDYLDAGHVTHGYAVTAHKAQGLTTGRTWVLGSDAVYREWGYVALSRGRHSNRLYLVSGTSAASSDEDLHAPESAADPIPELASNLRRSRAQHLALEQLGGAPPPAIEDRRPPSVDRDAMHRSLEAACAQTTTPEHRRLAQQRAAAIAQAETVQQRLDAAKQRAAESTGLRRLLSGDRLAVTRSHVAALNGDLEAWHEHITRLDQALSESAADLLHTARPHSRSTDEAPYPVDQVALRHVTEAAEFDPPDYLLAVIGASPENPTDRHTWRLAARAVEAYRAAWMVTDLVHALGAPPVAQGQRLAYDAAVAAVVAAGGQLSVDNSKEGMQRQGPADHDLGVAIA